MTLDVGGSADLRISALINPQNQGLRYIRIVKIYLAATEHPCPNELQQAQFAVRTLLQAIPRDILEDFEWCPWFDFNYESFLLLLRRQKRLRWINAIRLDPDNALVTELKKEPENYDTLFQGCRKLAIYPETQETLELGQLFLSKMPCVDELVVHSNFSHCRTFSARELNDSATAPGLVTRTLFSHMLPFDQCTPFANLTALKLVDVGLRHCAETYGRIFDFTRIEKLWISKCPGADALLSALCKTSHLPTNLRVLEVQHNDNAENDTLIALDGFLCLVQGINHLDIDLDNVKSLPAIDGICKHGKTLKTLLVHAFADDNDEELVYSTEDFTKLCKAATGLEQISCAWPPTSILKSPPKVNWAVYESAIYELSELVTLHITTFPSTTSMDGSMPRAIYEHLLQGLAQRIFQAAALVNPPSAGHKSSRLNLVAFGASDKIHERVDSKAQRIYFRSTYVTAEGKRALLAVLISGTLRQFVEPRSDVLDYSLRKAPRMPVKEWDLDDDDSVHIMD
ncbi:hypothetical protein MBLNU459_g1466t2 [Dothideomycetes sp. NU459]